MQFFQMYIDMANLKHVTNRFKLNFMNCFIFYSQPKWVFSCCFFLNFTFNYSINVNVCSTQHPLNPIVKNQFIRIHNYWPVCEWFNLFFICCFNTTSLTFSSCTYNTIWFFFFFCEICLSFPCSALINKILRDRWVWIFPIELLPLLCYM